MRRPVSVRLDDDVQVTLEDAARGRGVGLSTYLRELAAAEAQRVRRDRIRAQSRSVGDYVRADHDARAFYDDWGRPDASDASR